MTNFQVITIIFSGLTLLFAIVGVYIKTQIDIAKLQTMFAFLQRDLDGKEKSILKLERDNKEDHNAIMKKIDIILDRQNGK